MLKECLRFTDLLYLRYFLIYIFHYCFSQPHLVHESLFYSNVDPFSTSCIHLIIRHTVVWNLFIEVRRLRFAFVLQYQLNRHSTDVKCVRSEVNLNGQELMLEENKCRSVLMHKGTIQICLLLWDGWVRVTEQYTKLVQMKRKKRENLNVNYVIEC